MSIPTENAGRPEILRLRGSYDGKERRFDLEPGVYVLGSSASRADLTVAAPGISRLHARLTFGPEGLSVEDLGSTNGTIVDGMLLRSRSAFARREIEVGGASLRIEMLEREEIELAVALEPSSLGETPTPSYETVSLKESAHRDEGSFLQLLNRFLASRRNPEEPGSALSELCRELQIADACVARLPRRGEPVVLSTLGEPRPIPPFEEIYRASLPEPGSTARADSRRGSSRAAFLETDPRLAVGLMHGTERTPLALLLWGDFPQGADSALFLCTIVRLMDRILPVDRIASSERVEPKIIVPDDYRIGTSPPAVRLFEQMRPLLDGDLPVLISGETGVGKERIARILHASSNRSGGPFLAVNCAAIPNDLLEAEMFGIGKGVATGVEARRGKIIEAEGGSLFLDEIGEMSPLLQAKMLRALQEKEVTPLGGRTRSFDVRIISATNVDLGHELEQGTLRRDLYYRLAGFVLRVPPLRDCPDDVGPLVEAFLRRFVSETGTRVRGLTVSALRALREYSWPGNIRQLEHEIRRLVYSASDGEVLEVEHLSPEILDSTDQSRTANPESVSVEQSLAALVDRLESLSLQPLLDDVELRLIRRAMREAGGVKIEAARLLGVSRNGLAKKLRRLGIDGDRGSSANL